MPEGWLPPQAPGGRPPPRFDMVIPEPASERAPALEPPAPFEAPTAPRAEALAPAGQPQVKGLALTSVILGVIGLGLTVITAGLGFLFSLPCSIGAWICGTQARGRIDTSPTMPGRGQAQAGRLLGIIGVLVTVAALVAWLVWLASGGDFNELQRDLERWRDEQTRQAVVQAARALLAR
jgi:hypothetical protein